MLKNLSDEDAKLKVISFLSGYYNPAVVLGSILTEDNLKNELYFNLNEAYWP